MQIGTKMRRIGPSDGYTAGGLAHWCPACEGMHAFAIDGKNSNGAQWTWDGNIEQPTFTPSMNITVNPPNHPHFQKDIETSICHYVVTAGRIAYCGDSTHALANTTIDMPELPVERRD